MRDDFDDLIDTLILAGLLEVAGIDSRTGEFLYSFTPKVAEIDPEFFNDMQNAIHNQILQLWAAGFLDIRMYQGEPMVSLTEQCMDMEAIEKLDSIDQAFLFHIISKFEQQ